jgi:hypothetical protein
VPVNPSLDALALGHGGMTWRHSLENVVADAAARFSVGTGTVQRIKGEMAA